MSFTMARSQEPSSARRCWRGMSRKRWLGWEVMEMMDHEAPLRSKTAQQQRLAAASQLMAASVNSFPYSSKCMNFVLQQQQTDSQRAAAAALMMGDDMHKFSRSRLERSDFSMEGKGEREEKGKGLARKNGENWNWKMGTLRVLGSKEGKVGMEMVVELSAAKKIPAAEMADLGEEEDDDGFDAAPEVVGDVAVNGGFGDVGFGGGEDESFNLLVYEEEGVEEVVGRGEVEEAIGHGFGKKKICFNF
ncbi:hypothetical protein ACFX15_045142 [Malus domestica]